MLEILAALAATAGPVGAIVAACLVAAERNYRRERELERRHEADR